MESFMGGGGSVLINKPIVASEIYNDISSDVVNVFRQLRINGDRLREQLSLTPYSRDEFMLSLEPCSDELERARRTIVRSMMSFGGAGIHNKSSGFRAVANNGTSAPKRWFSYIDTLEKIQERFKHVSIENRDALDLLKIHDSIDTLYYLDPPYLMSTRVKGTNKYANEMTEEYHRKLAETVKNLDAKVIISGYHSALYDELYADFNVVEKSAIASSFKGGVKRTEVLWLSPNITSRSLF